MVFDLRLKVAVMWERPERHPNYALLDAKTQEEQLTAVKDGQK